MKPRTVWLPRMSPPPGGWRFCMMTAQLINNATGATIDDQWIETMPRFVSRTAPATEDIPYHEAFAELGLDPALLYYDTGREW